MASNLTRSDVLKGKVDELGRIDDLEATDSPTFAALTITGDVGCATVTATTGVQSTAQAITATSDGLTTGLITSGSSYVTVTSASANNIATLPAATVGHTIRGYVGANGCEIRTPASSGATINNVDSDGTNEAAIPATSMFEVTCVAADTWILRAWTELGAVITAIVPD